MNSRRRQGNLDRAQGPKGSPHWAPLRYALCRVEATPPDGQESDDRKGHILLVEASARASPEPSLNLEPAVRHPFEVDVRGDHRCGPVCDLGFDHLIAQTILGGLPH